jgi:hypothetical protein
VRSCVTYLVLLALAAACGYSIWQVRLLRQEVEELQARLLTADRGAGESMLDHTRAALEALRQGDLRRSREELNKLGEMIEQAQVIGAQQRARLRQRLAAAREALAHGGARAGELIEDLRRELSRPEDSDRPPRSLHVPAEP